MAEEKDQLAVAYFFTQLEDYGKGKSGSESLVASRRSPTTTQPASSRCISVFGPDPFLPPPNADPPFPRQSASQPAGIGTERLGLGLVELRAQVGTRCD